MSEASSTYTELKRRHEELLAELLLTQTVADSGGAESEERTQAARFKLSELQSKVAETQKAMRGIVQLDRDTLYRMGELLDGLQRDLVFGDRPTEEQVRLHAEIHSSAILAVECQRGNPEVAKLGEGLLDRCAALDNEMRRRLSEG